MSSPIPNPTSWSAALLSLSTHLLPQSHLLIYSTLFGAQIYQTFIVTGLNFRVLPRPAFKTLQKKAFPLYFRFQTAFVVFTAVTVPSGGLFSLLGVGVRVGDGKAARTSTLDMVALGVAGATALLNLLVYGPRTTVAMVEKTHQGQLVLVLVTETRSRETLKRVKPPPPQLEKDGLDNGDDDENDHDTNIPFPASTSVPGPNQDPHLIAASRNFSRNHAMSIHLNLITVIATLAYGWSLAGRMSIS